MLKGKSILAIWKHELGSLYDEREVQNMFFYYLEDVFALTKSTVLAHETWLTSDIESQLSEALCELKTGKPFQYIVGFTYFADLKITVSNAVLIPRPETEELVYWIKEELSTSFNGVILDWCTGSGCIALALKNELPKATIIGKDISESALKCAKQNAENLDLSVDFRFDDALSPNRDENKYDVIVSNPPYIPIDEQAEMRLNVVKFEPEIALFVPNKDPLLFYRAIAQYAQKHLKSGGHLFFELHEKFAQETIQMLSEFGFSAIEIKKDLQNKDRMLHAQR